MVELNLKITGEDLLKKEIPVLIETLQTLVSNQEVDYNSKDTDFIVEFPKGCKPSIVGACLADDNDGETLDIYDKVRTEQAKENENNSEPTTDLTDLHKKATEVFKQLTQADTDKARAKEVMKKYNVKKLTEIINLLNTEEKVTEFINQCNEYLERS